MLNVARSLVALWFAACACAAASEPADLLVGNVRDTTGEPVAGASLHARDARGRVVGSGGTAPDGTFAFAVAGPADALDVACSHCRPLSVATKGQTNVAVLVTRYAALESDVPTASDLAALPYERIVDGLALIPFVLPAPDGSQISDRGLGGGRGIVSDDGVPLVDLARGTCALAGFPDRYARSIALTGPERAFAYGSYAAGGVFALDRLAGDETAASLATGDASGLALQPQFGVVYPGYAESSDSGALTRRADIDVRSGFAGGVLRAGLTGTAQSIEGAGSRSSDLAHASYATVSRRYRTFADLAVARVLASDASAAESYRSSYSEAGVRLEHPGRVTVAAGGFERMQTAVLASDGAGPEQLSGRVTDTTAYAEATSGDSGTNATVALGVSRLAIGQGRDVLASTQRWAVLPSIAGRVALGKTTYTRAGYSQALRVPTLLETQALQSAPTLERSALEEAAVGFDTGGRVRGEAIVFRESTGDFRNRRLDGLGASVVWQVTPLVTLRAWSLHDSALQSYLYGGDAQRSRHLVWLTYGNTVRADAIVHRDAAGAGAPIVLDVGVNVPLARAAALHAGTWTTLGARRYTLGLETR